MDIQCETKKTSIKCKCPKCNEIVEGCLDSLPIPDMLAETASQSSDCIGGILICPKCGKEIDYSISKDFNGYVICVPSDLEIL
ncbi:MAG: hypothetical protein II973_06260 [Spirochaetaceae bacterium]|nr:hypothetical protein [Spirochaetaceae bacterium]